MNDSEFQRYIEHYSPKPNDIGSLSDLGKYGGNTNIALLLHILSNFPGYGFSKENATPQVGAMVSGEDFGIPRTSDAQHIPFQKILQQYPTLSLQDALQLAGAYIYPKRAREYGSSIQYLKAHEGSHEMDKLSQFTRGSMYPSEGIGNQGYMPTNRTRNVPIAITPAQIENWLLNYREQSRPEERSAHIKGLQAIGAYEE